MAVNHQIGYRDSITQQISSLKIKIYNTLRKNWEVLRNSRLVSTLEIFEYGEG